MTHVRPPAPHAVSRPVVISVGNLAMGGRGKTPTVARLASMLRDAGERPAILSRGYKRRRPEAGVVVVSDGLQLRADLDRAGDEPLMLARCLPGVAVLVCPVRTRAAAVAQAELGATVLLLDDGFQHRAMPRDLDLVLVSPGDLTDRRLPLGRLRSSVSALARADAVILDGAADAAALARVAPGAAVFHLARRLGEPRWLEEAGRTGAAVPLPRAGESVGVVMVAGIAAPSRFRDALSAAGWTVVDALTFRDHHHFVPRDLVRMRATLARTGAEAIVTTEKDAVRLLPFRPLGVPVVVVPLEVSIEPAEAFATWVGDQMAQHRGAAGRVVPA